MHEMIDILKIDKIQSFQVMGYNKSLLIPNERSALKSDISTMMFLQLLKQTRSKDNIRTVNFDGCRGELKWDQQSSKSQNSQSRLVYTAAISISTVFRMSSSATSYHRALSTPKMIHCEEKKRLLLKRRLISEFLRMFCECNLIEMSKPCGLQDLSSDKEEILLIHHCKKE